MCAMDFTKGLVLLTIVLVHVYQEFIINVLFVFCSYMYLLHVPNCPFPYCVIYILSTLINSIINIYRKLLSIIELIIITIYIIGEVWYISILHSFDYKVNISIKATLGYKGLEPFLENTNKAQSFQT